MSTELSLNLSSLNERLEKLARVNLGELSSLVAAEGESQTRRRLSIEKKAPDGSSWSAWTDSYAKKRHGGHSLLEREGGLIDSITSDSRDSEAIWGSNLVYAAAQNFGYENNNLPAREFLGLSEENTQDMLALIDDWIDSVVSLQ